MARRGVDLADKRLKSRVSTTKLTRVMVLCAVARPRQVGGAHFDGLIGIYAFTENHIYQRKEIKYL